MMLKQTLAKYKTIMLGNGKGSIYDFGCYLVSLVEGLNTKGYNFSIEGFNEALKYNKCWVGEFQNYIDVDNIATKYPEIFKSFKKVTTWPSNDQLNSWLSGNYVVVCQVDAKGIGGSGTHFVVLKEMQGNTAIVGDPWYGDIKPVTLRYGKLGNILSLRVFEIKPLQVTPSLMPDTTLSDFLAHNEVKTLEEFQTMHDEQVKFLADERIKTNGLESTIKDLNTKHSDFVQKIISLINAFGNPLGLTDEELAIKGVTELVKSTSDLQGALTAQEKAADKQKQLLEGEKLALQKQLDKLQAQFDTMQAKHADDLEKMQERIDKVKEGVDANTVKQDDFETLKRLLTPLVNIVKGWYGKTK